MMYIILLSILAIILMFICILFFPVVKIKNKTFDTFYIPTLIIAIIIFFLPSFNKEEYFNILFSNSDLNPLKILILFISVSFISIVLDTSGFFAYIASIFINKYKSSQKVLFTVLYIIISLLTIFTSNDIVILTFTPFILYFSKKGNINPLPYLVMEFVAANTYSMLLIIGNPTNIYLSSVFHLTFLDYLNHMLIPTLIIGISSFILLNLLFRVELKKEIKIFELEQSKIKNNFIYKVSLAHLIGVTLMLVISNYINLEMWIIAIIFALSLLIFISIYSIINKNKECLLTPLKRIPYNLIPFVLSMFTLICALDSLNVFVKIHDLLSNNSILYLISSTLMCNIVNNIPMTLAYGSIIGNASNINIIYATIIGSNIGAILTPVGALAGIMWMRLLKTNNVNYSFLDFSKNGVIITIFLLISSSLSLLIF